MPSINDVFTQLVDVNAKLQQLHTDLANVIASTDAVRSTVEQDAVCCAQTNQRLAQVINTLNAGFTNVSQGFLALLTQQNFSNRVLVHQSNQNDTIMCILEQIAQRTCNLLNEAHVQTGVQSSINEHTSALLELQESAHPDAALERERLEQMRQKLRVCCPPEEPQPACTHSPCAVPTGGGDPPRVDFVVFQPPTIPD